MLDKNTEALCVLFLLFSIERVDVSSKIIKTGVEVCPLDLSPRQAAACDRCFQAFIGGGEPNADDRQIALELCPKRMEYKEAHQVAIAHSRAMVKDNNSVFQAWLLLGSAEFKRIVQCARDGRDFSQLRQRRSIKRNCKRAFPGAARTRHSCVHH